MEEAASSLWLCAGQDEGCEAVVHAMQCIFQDPDTEAILLVDATNALTQSTIKLLSTTSIPFVHHWPRH